MKHINNELARVLAKLIKQNTKTKEEAKKLAKQVIGGDK